ncbi:MAG TPA: Gfo/Idh/MocA family oxidoreductase [Bryobacteraceae bacterium]
MDSRRKFLGKVAGLAGTTIAAVPSRVLGANDRVRVGLIGAGDRGTELYRQAMSIPGVEMVAFADVYTRRLEAAKKAVPSAETYLDHRRLLEDHSIDAVLIATPQHLHCEHFVHSLEAGKHVYQEKTMAFNVADAKHMRAAYQDDGGKHVVQIGHQSCSSGQTTDARSFLADNKVGRITSIHAHMYRNTPHGKPQWSRPVYPDMNGENVLWASFQGPAPNRDFDANRFVNWRFFWDYSGGNVYENMCHQAAFWYKVLNLQIPRAATMTGGVYLWKDGREVPDTMSVALEHPEELLFSWDSAFGNNQLGSSEDVLGTDGTISKGAQIRYAPQKVNRPEGAELLGRTVASPNAHMQNFIDAIRHGDPVNCPFDVGFRVSIACRMAVQSYLERRTIHWDAAREELI